MSTATVQITTQAQADVNESAPPVHRVQMFTTLVATRTIHEAHESEIILPGTVMLVVNANGGSSPHVLFPTGEDQACYGRLSSTLLKESTRVAHFRDHLPLTAQLFHAHTATQGEIQLQRYYVAGEYVEVMAQIMDDRGGVIPRGTFMQCLEGGERPRFRYVHHLSYEVLEHVELHALINRRVRPVAAEEKRDVDRYVHLDITHQVDQDDLEEGYCLSLSPTGGKPTMVIKRAGLPATFKVPHDQDLLEYEAITFPTKPNLVCEILREFRNNTSRADTRPIAGLSNGELISAYADYRLSWLSPVMSFREFMYAEMRREEIRSGTRAVRGSLHELLQT